MDDHNLWIATLRSLFLVDTNFWERGLPYNNDLVVVIRVYSRGESKTPEALF